MLKITAILLTFLSSSAVGFYKAYEVKRRKQLLVEFQDLILQIVTEISYFKVPLPLIFQRIQPQDNTAASILMRQIQLGFLTEKNKENVPFSVLWEQAIMLTYKEEPLKKDDLQLMAKCGLFLGQSDYKNQQQQLDIFLAQLNQAIEDADQIMKTKGSLYRKAGISVGAVLAIAFL